MPETRACQTGPRSSRQQLGPGRGGAVGGRRGEGDGGLLAEDGAPPGRGVVGAHVDLDPAVLDPDALADHRLVRQQGDLQDHGRAGGRGAHHLRLDLPVEAQLQGPLDDHEGGQALALPGVGRARGARGGGLGADQLERLAHRAVLGHAGQVPAVQGRDHHVWSHGVQGDLHGLATGHRALEHDLMVAGRQPHPQPPLVAQQRGAGAAVDQHGGGQPVLGQAGQRDRGGGGRADLQPQAQLLRARLQQQPAEAEAIRLAGRRLQQPGAQLIEQLLRAGTRRPGRRAAEPSTSSSTGTPGNQRRKLGPGLASALRNSSSASTITRATPTSATQRADPGWAEPECQPRARLDRAVPGQLDLGPLPARHPGAGLHLGVGVVGGEAAGCGGAAGGGDGAGAAGAAARPLPRMPETRGARANLAGRGRGFRRDAGQACEAARGPLGSSLADAPGAERLQHPAVADGLGQPVLVRHRRGGGRRARRDGLLGIEGHEPVGVQRAGAGREGRIDRAAHLPDGEGKQDQQQRERGPQPVQLGQLAQLTGGQRAHERLAEHDGEPDPGRGARLLHHQGEGRQRQQAGAAAEQAGHGDGDQQDQEQMQQGPALDPGGVHLVGPRGVHQPPARGQVQGGVHRLKAVGPAHRGDAPPAGRQAAVGLDRDLVVADLDAGAAAFGPAGDQLVDAADRHAAQEALGPHLQAPAAPEAGGDLVARRVAAAVEIQPQPPGQRELIGGGLGVAAPALLQRQGRAHLHQVGGQDAPGVRQGRLLRVDRGCARHRHHAQVGLTLPDPHLVPLRSRDRPGRGGSAA